MEKWNMGNHFKYLGVKKDLKGNTLAFCCPYNTIR